MRSVLVLICLTCLSYSVRPQSVHRVPCEHPVKIELAPSMVINDRTLGNVSALFDEQRIAGDPSRQTAGKPVTIWSPGFGPVSHPASVSIDLKDPVQITELQLFDVNDKGTFTVEALVRGKWEMIVQDELTSYQNWNQHRVDVFTQNLRFTRSVVGANVSEVVLYGCASPDERAPDAPSDLQIVQTYNHNIKIAWTATGDDGKDGIATAYDIRYSESPIEGEQDFESATRIGNIDKPRLPGTIQTFLLSRLEPATKYFFAMKVLDDKSKSSPMSNTVSGTTVTGEPRAVITMDELIGANAFIDDPLNRIQAVGFIREYHNWSWDDDAESGFPMNAIKWAPSYAGKGWNFDEFYQQLAKMDIGVSPVVMGIPRWLKNPRGMNVSVSDPEDPNSYSAKAHHMYQYAARYGQTKVSSEKLTIAADQSQKSGLGLIHYIEDWNEQDNSWSGNGPLFSPEAYAAMASADYDGHAGTMKGKPGTFGVKSADPEIKLVMGGLTTINLDWIDAMKVWFENNRSDHKFAVDVINVHHYAWLDGSSWKGGGPPKSPEEDKFLERMRELVNYRDNNFPDVEVWISEFGWDTNPGSPLCAPSIGTFDVEEVQGQWLVRAYLAFAAAGVDRAQMFMLRDVNPYDGKWFSSCGLVGPKNDWRPKKSWYYVYTLKNLLKGSLYAGELESSDPRTRIYKFKKTNSSEGIYVVWAATREDYVVKNLQIEVGKGVKMAKLTEMKVGEINGTSSIMDVRDGKVSLRVTERPVFITVDYME